MHGWMDGWIDQISHDSSDIVAGDMSDAFRIISHFGPTCVGKGQFGVMKMSITMVMTSSCIQPAKTVIIEGSLEVKLPTIWTDEKQRCEESAKRREEERRSKKRKSQKKEDPGAPKGRKVAKHCVFRMICGSGGSKSRLAKAAGAEPAGQMRDEKLHALWREAHFQVKMCKTHQVRTTFGSWDVEKVHAGGGAAEPHGEALPFHAGAAEPSLKTIRAGFWWPPVTRY